jgi:hypothetical protein
MAGGGAAFKPDLTARIARHLPGIQVRSSAQAGLPPDQIEAAAFAWLARAFVGRRPGNCVEVTDAIGQRVIGALPESTTGRRSWSFRKRDGRSRAAVDDKAKRFQTEKLDPQPQVVVALGFLITNCAPWRSSL